MIFPGYGNKNLTIPDANKQILESFKGYLNDDAAKESLVKFMRANLGWTVELMTGHKLFPFQEAMIRGMMNKDFFLTIAARGLSKCKKWDSLVLTQDGMKKFIDVKIGDKIFADREPQLVLNKWVNEERDGIELTTKRGYFCDGVLEHKVYTFDKNTLEFKYKNLKDINFDDIIPIRHSMEYWGDSDVARDFYNGDSKELYYYFGLILGDGCIKGERNCVGLTTEDIEIANYVKNVYSKLKFQTNFNIRKSSGSDKILDIRTCSKSLIEMVESVGFDKSHYAHQKNIPSKILSSKGELVASFLRGLFDTDGYCSLQKNKNKLARSCVIGLTSSSPYIIRTVKSLLLNFGIISNTVEVHPGGDYVIMGNKCKTHKAWSLQITGYTYCKRFYDRIGFNLSRKENILKEYIDGYIPKNDYGTNLVPIGNYFKKKYILYRWRKWGIRIHKNISVERLKQIISLGLLDKEDTAKVNKIIYGNYFFDTIESIEQNKTITVDVTVDKEACYWSEGFINHNSWTTAHFIWLYALFNPGIRIGILSSGFRQAKLIFQTIEGFANSSNGQLLKACFEGDPQHGSDMWEMSIGESKIIALPLGSGGSKLRGFRFQVIVIDELLLMPEVAINEVIMPFLSSNSDPVKRKEITEAEDEMIEKGMMKEEERTKFQNPKFIGLSSASYQFEFLYKLYKEYTEKVTTKDLKDEHGNPVDTHGYGVMQLSWEVAPKHLYSEETIRKFKSQMSEQQFNREFGSQFTDDSGGFFSKRKMDLCTIPMGQEPTIEVVGEKDAKYLLSIDPAFSKDESADHFAMSLLKLNEKDRTTTLVHSYAIAGGQLQDHIKYLSYLLTYFNIVYLVIDNAGHWFIDECNASVIFNERGLKLDFFDADFESDDYLRALRKAKESYEPIKMKICQTQVFTSSWIRKANELLSASFDHYRLFFGSAPSETKFEKLRKMDIGLDDLIYDNPKGGDKLKGEARMIDFIDHQSYLIDLVKSETALIEVKSTPNGTQTFQLPQSLRRSSSPDRARRDNYTTILMGNYAAKCYFDMTQKDIKQSVSFVPFFL